jgi:hypothetical protein
LRRAHLLQTHAAARHKSGGKVRPSGSLYIVIELVDDFAPLGVAER